MDQIAGTVRGAVDELDVTSRFVIGPQGAEDELGTASDGRQEIAEVMGHFTRQPPDGLHLLRLAALLFESQPAAGAHGAS